MFKFSFLLLLLSSCALNRVDKHPLKQGRWKLYYDDAKKQLMWKACYKMENKLVIGSITLAQVNFTLMNVI